MTPHNQVANLSGADQHHDEWGVIWQQACSIISHSFFVQTVKVCLLERHKFANGGLLILVITPYSLSCFKRDDLRPIPENV